MYSFVFDLDDTLYDQLQPFSLAFEKNFGEYKNITLLELYKKHRYYSDSVFEASSTGAMGMREMHIYRIKAAMRDYNIDISNDEALIFQLDYENFQNQITIPSDIRAALEYCQKENYFLGIITNGPSTHQRNKINQLNIIKWVPISRIIVSGDYEFAKPDKRIFLEFQNNHNLNPEKTYYIGDSFPSDVVGAKRAGWKSIWANHRNRDRTDEKISPDFILEKGESLVDLLKRITS